MAIPFDTPTSQAVTDRPHIPNPLLAEYPASIKVRSNDQPSLTGEFINSFGYAALQSPYDGVRQLVNVSAGKEQLAQRYWFDTPQETEFGKDPLRRVTQLAGNALGMAVPIFLVQGALHGSGKLLFGLARPGLTASTVNLLANPSIKTSLAIAESTLTGGVYEGALRPVVPQEGEFWAARQANAGFGALSFGSWALAAAGLKAYDTTRFTGSQAWRVNSFTADLKRTFLSGGVAGAVDIEARSGGTASAQDVFTSAGSFAVMGAATRGLHEVVPTLKRPGQVRIQKSDTISQVAQDPQSHNTLSEPLSDNSALDMFLPDYTTPQQLQPKTPRLVSLDTSRKTSLELPPIPTDNLQILYEKLSRPTFGSEDISGHQHAWLDVLLSDESKAERNQMRESSKPVRYYTSTNDLKTQIIIPESYAQKLDQVRRQRMNADQPQGGLSEFEHYAQRKAQHRQKPNDFTNCLLPEELLHLLQELPNPTLIKKAYLLDADQSSPTATASLDGDIRLNKPTNSGDGSKLDFNTTRGAIKDLWSYLLKTESHMESHWFDASRALQVDGRKGDPSLMSRNDAWVELLRKGLLNPSESAFKTISYGDPIGSAILARALRRTMEFTPSSLHGPNHDLFLHRVQYIENRILPKAREALVSVLNGKSEPASKDCAAELLLEFGNKTDWSKLSNLLDINFAGKPIDEFKLAVLQVAPHVQNVDLSRNTVTEVALGHMDHIANLKRLNLRKTNISNIDLYALLPSQTLEALDLSHTYITDSIVRLLAECPRLRQLSVADTLMSNEATALLRTLLPHCDIWC